MTREEAQRIVDAESKGIHPPMQELLTAICTLLAMPAEAGDWKCFCPFPDGDDPVQCKFPGLECEKCRYFKQAKPIAPAPVEPVACVCGPTLEVVVRKAIAEYSKLLRTHGDSTWRTATARMQALLEFAVGGKDVK